MPYQRLLASPGARELKKRLAQDSMGPPFALAWVLYAGSFILSPTTRSGVIESLAPVWLSIAWVTALGAGGLTFLVGRFANRMRMELIGCVLIAYGLAMYMAAIFVRLQWAAWISEITFLSFVVGFAIRGRVLQVAIKSRTNVSHTGE